MKTYVFGHIKPDLDSVVAALAFTEYMKIHWDPNSIPVIIDELNQETKFVFEKFDLTPPQLLKVEDITTEDRVVLVDHNEAGQRLPGLNQNQIAGIFDHHKANLNFSSPIEINILPVGSSNTLAWILFKNLQHPIEKQLASLMLCAILSDTVGLKSSTTTKSDEVAVLELASIASIQDISALTLEIFKAKSNISALSDEQVVLNDYKVLDITGKKVLCGQIETVEQETLLTDRKQGLLSVLQSIKLQQGVDFIMLAITDILKINTKLLVSGVGEIELIQKAFGGTVVENILDIGPKMSRKKDIAPAIEKALTHT
ncbi:manganese-dependent inorganic pyrophosphatase [Candidatus Collierbacteria bacterium CG10_big_fil_rev_8_21_14_0_10_43_36]|uniref:inorganic diphosphatase n=1 Tax=Candidatus Collierbacteria bacterium CG10_big_fil_rev_8_21_14_0_10_43_36 TaxID=1974534 RepID=A0A2H0VJW8_9BACT|nr:manganese-dependent inorganic pyrophosphatase [bacterium]PIR99381.1 MAG: manganese-dependent inorganic pyrophosphatase [Candidatus Collierbacteria bacterium CG10_big_fil_rev_8_21_14_0_10_43_36]